jgi:hypothetical protein
MQDHVLYDEGLWAHNAREHAIFGSWVMDENNSSLVATPLYALALDRVYAALGVGLVQTRLLTALAGWATCLVLFALALRVGAGSRRFASLATFLFGASYFVLSYHRVAFVESFQLLFVTASMACLAAAEERPRLAAAAGALFVASVLAKTSAVLLAPIVPLYWLLRAGRRGPGAPPLSSLAGEIGWFAVGSGLPALAVTVLWVLPHFTLVATTLAYEAGPVLPASFPGLVGSLGQFGLHFGAHVGFDGFAAQTPILVAGVALLALQRLGRVRREPARAGEQLAWVWLLGGSLSVAIQRYQPDRRLLLLLPPMAILAAQAFASRRVALPSPSDLTRPMRLAVGALLGILVGFYARPYVAEPVRELLSRVPDLPQGDLPGIGLGGAGLAAWVGFGLLGAGTCALAARRGLRLRASLPAWIPIVAFAVLGLGRFGVYASRLSYSEVEAAHAVRTLLAPWPSTRRVAEGDVAAAVALEAPLFDFTIPSESDSGWVMNQDGWTRFRPALVLRAGRVGPVPPAPILRAPDGDRFVLWRDLAIWPDWNGQPRMHIAVYVDPALSTRFDETPGRAARGPTSAPGTAVARYANAPTESALP